VAWEIAHTDEFFAWWESLTAKEQRAISAAIGLLERDGPALGRPLVDTVHGSRHANMKELRVSTIRILFAFDPRRVAILLIGGNKAGRWQEWYDEMIPVADRLYDAHLRTIGRPGEP
jgi:hypothetical protein